MSARPCPTILGDCIGTDSPIIGLSSQAEDPRYFYAACTPGWDAYGPPPLGGGIVVPTCDYLLFAGLTQAEADARAAEACGSPVPPVEPVVIYYSNEQTATVPCVPRSGYLLDDQNIVITDDQGEKIEVAEGGSGQFLTATASIPHGAFSSVISQADADAQAYALAFQLASSAAAAQNCDPISPEPVLTGAGGDPLLGAGGEPVEPVSW